VRKAREISKGFKGGKNSVRRYMEQNNPSIDSTQSEMVTWLAKQLFTASPQNVTGLKFYFLDCYCIYYQRVSRNGEVDEQFGIYREASDGPCEVCMA